MPTPFGNGLLTMMCCLGNTFMSDGTINKDAEISAHERGTPVIVAWHQHGGSGGNPRSRLWHLVAPSLPISQRRASDRPCSVRCRALGGSNLVPPQEIDGDVMQQRSEPHILALSRRSAHG